MNIIALQKKSILGSFVALLFVLLLYILSFSQILKFFDLTVLSNQSSLIWGVIKASAIQSTLSASVAVFVSLLIAYAVYSINKPIATKILFLFNISFTLPSLIVISIFVLVYGKSGIINNLISTIFDKSYRFSIYGLIGIVLAHLYYLCGYGSNLLHSELIKIPGEQIKLSQQLRLSRWKVFIILKLSYLRSSMLQFFILSWVLSFSSFAIVLFLGGGPKWSTLEVLIYQAVNIEVNFKLATMVGIIHLIVTITLISILNSLLNKYTVYQSSNDQYRVKASNIEESVSWFIFIIGICFVLLPMFYLVINGFFSLSDYKIYPWLELLQSFGNSIAISSLAALINILLCYFILQGLRWVLVTNPRLGSNLINLSLINMIYPSILLAFGFFLLLIKWQNPSWIVLVILISLTNAFSALPFTIKIAQTTFLATTSQWKQIEILNLKTSVILKHIEWPQLKKVIASCFVFTLILSLGDYTIIAFFTNFDISTLPSFLSGQLGALNQKIAAITTSIFMITILLIQGLYLYLQTSKKK